MPEPSVSIVMSLYNDARFVEAATASVLAQTFPDFELIVVDDGAIDDSAEIVARFNDPRIRMIRQENRGLAAALNRGIAAARAPLIARQDADDVSEPDRLRRLVEVLQRDPSLVLLGTNAALVDEEGELVTTTRFATDDAALRAAMLGGRGNQFAHGSVLFRREVAEKVGLYRTEFAASQDLDLWLRMMEHGRIANIADALYRWRFRRGATGTSRFVSQIEYARLAVSCATCRRRGEPEPPLVIASTTRKRAARFFVSMRTVSGDAGYEMNIAKTLLANGESSRARRHALRSLRHRPLNLYAWTLTALTLLPHRVASRAWTALRKLYRRVIWRQ